MEKEADVNRLVEAFARNLRNRRQEMGLTQEQLAEICGLSTNFVARMEIGRSTPSFSRLAKIAGALRVTVSELLSMEYKASGCDVGTTVSALLDPLNDEEREYVLSQLQGSVHFLVSTRKTVPGE